MMKPGRKYGIAILKFAVIMQMLWLFWLSGCQESDDVPPVITLNGDDTVSQVLNEPYNDLGAKAIDETDGDITDQIYTENTVNVDLLGWYTVKYKAVDKAGNVASPVTRVVHVINLAYPYISNYQVSEKEIFPGQDSCSYNTYIWVDSTVNMRVVLYGFSCNPDLDAFADIADTMIVMPFQIISDSTSSTELQGSGILNDSTISFDYSRKTDNISSYWHAILTR